MYIDKVKPIAYDPCEEERTIARPMGRAEATHGALLENAIFRRLSVARLADMIRKTIREPYVHWRRRNIAIAQLEALDNRILRDIGLERGQIASAVDGMLACRGETAARTAETRFASRGERT